MRVCTFNNLLEKKSNFSNFKVVNYNNEWFTWKQIDEYSQIVANDLTDLGIKKDSHVGIFIKTSINWIITFLAIQRLGAISVLLNDIFSDNELNQACIKVDLDCICTGRQYSPPKNLKKLKIYDISNFEKIKNRKIKSFTNKKDNSSTLEDKSIIIFTSGTTGKEKAVLLSFQNLMVSELMPSTFFENHRFICALPLFHILGFFCITLMFSTTNSTFILSPTLIPDNIVQLIQKFKCSIIFSVPTLLYGIAGSPYLTEECASFIKIGLLGGSSILKEQISFIRSKFINCKILTGYGMSETSVISFTTPNDSDEIIASSIGKPRKDVILKIVNPQTKIECKTGEVGELIIKGKNINTQYYDKNENQNLYDSEGFIHSGDLAYKNDNGYYFICGRLKNLIIRGGENIIPSELASAIIKYPGIKNVEVVGIPDTFYGEVAAAAIIPDKEQHIINSNMITFLKSKLTVNKIPKYFIEFESYPLLANGKTNLIKLKEILINRIKDQKAN